MTAIVSVFTPDGFVIGADGRRIDSLNDIIVSESVQKIFPFESTRIRLAYAWCGLLRAVNKDMALMFDLHAYTDTILKVAANLAGQDFSLFLDMFIEGLRRVSPSQITNMPKEELARVILVGYWWDQPFSAKIELNYPNGVLTLREEFDIPAQYQMNIFSGAESVFPKYKDAQPQSDEEAIEFVQKYIRDCADSIAPDCAGIGGHIHIAQVKPQEFTWFVRPL